MDVHRGRDDVHRPIQLNVLGVIGEYIGDIHDKVKGARCTSSASSRTFRHAAAPAAGSLPIVACASNER